ncbi:hypothetical protein S83_004850 [Arachis hypogaea]
MVIVESECSVRLEGEKNKPTIRSNAIYLIEGQASIYNYRLFALAISKSKFLRAVAVFQSYRLRCDKLTCVLGGVDLERKTWRIMKDR